jgi:hypothetical protein
MERDRKQDLRDEVTGYIAFILVSALGIVAMVV